MIRVHVALVATVLWACAAFAQHSSTGSKSASGSSGSSGGSHGSYSGSSGGYSGGHSSGEYSGGGHGSAGSSSHGSASGSGTVRSRGSGSSGRVLSGAPSAPHYIIQDPHSENPHVIQERQGGSLLKTPPPEKRGFLSSLFHPFHKSPPVSELRHRICLQGT